MTFIRALTFFMVFVAATPAGAAEVSPPPADIPAKVAQAPAVKNTADTAPVPSTIANLSKAYWRLAKPDEKDSNVLDYFIMINDCRTYWKNRDNDFEWNKVREKTRAYLSQYSNRFPTRFIFTQPLFFGEYDFDKKGFPLAMDTSFERVKRLQISQNTGELGNGCPLVNRLGPYTRNAVVNMKLVMHMPFVPVDERTAKMFLTMKADQSEKSGVITNRKEEGRDAYMRMVVDLDRYIGDTRESGEVMHEYFGRVIRYEVYADPELTFKLHEKSYQY